MIRDFQGKAAFVTGAASGIGLAIARALATANMRVMLADIEENALHAALADLKGSSADVRAVVCDVSDRASVQGAAEQTCTRTRNIAPRSRSDLTRSSLPSIRPRTHNDSLACQAVIKMQRVTGFNASSALQRWRVYVPRMRLDAQSGAILLGDEQEVSADVHRLRIGQVNVSSPGALLPNHISVGRAAPLLNLQMVPDFGCDLAPCFNTIPASHARLSGRDENGIFGK
jgi:NAD(P)-dependent dehydrogenase (short-subunit alcohol dehydrogenase family)